MESAFVVAILSLGEEPLTGDRTLASKWTDFGLCEGVAGFSLAHIVVSIGSKC